MFMNKLLDETKNMCKYKQLMLFFWPQKNPTTGTGVFMGPHTVYYSLYYNEYYDCLIWNAYYVLYYNVYYDCLIWNVYYSVDNLDVIVLE